jgi:hypothetical protein
VRDGCEDNLVAHLIDLMDDKERRFDQLARSFDKTNAPHMGKTFGCQRGRALMRAIIS